MSDTPVPQGTDTPSVPVVPAVAAPVVPPSPPAVPKVDMTPAQLKERLDEERAKGEKRAQEALAKDLGIDIDTAKKLIAEAKAKDDAQKSEVQKLAEQKAALEAQLAQYAPYKQAVEGRAAIEFAALSAEQQEAVKVLAGDDPAARLRTIDALKPTWAAAHNAAQEAARVATEKAAADAAKAAEEAKKAAPAPKIPAPANTTPATPPPPPVQPGTPTNHFAVWEDLKTRNPAAAAIYRVKHDAAIRAAQRQATG